MLSEIREKKRNNNINNSNNKNKMDSKIPISVCFPYLRQLLAEEENTEDAEDQERDVYGEKHDAETCEATNKTSVSEKVLIINNNNDNSVSDDVPNESNATDIFPTASHISVEEGAAIDDDNDDNIVDRVLTASDVFHANNEYPVAANRLRRILGKGEISKGQMGEDLKRCYPILHEDVIPLLCAFLESKKFHGSVREKTFYNGMSLIQFVDRLVAKRPLKFVGDFDSYILRDTRKTGACNWESIGTDSECEPLVLENYMSYDEIKLASFLCASSPVYPINSGKRHNGGISDYEKAPFVDRAIFVGVVGARMVKDHVMEAQEVFIKEEQNIPAEGYGIEAIKGCHYIGYDGNGCGDGDFQCGDGDNGGCDDGDAPNQSNSVKRGSSKTTRSIINRSHSHQDDNNGDDRRQVPLPPPLLPLMARFYGMPFRNFPTFAEMKKAYKAADRPSNAVPTPKPATAAKELASGAASGAAYGAASVSVTASVSASQRVESSSAFRKVRDSWKKMKRKILFSDADVDLVALIENERIVHRSSRDSTSLFFNVDVYEKRTRITVETFLLEADYRAKVEGKRAYVHVVGFGLGVWKVLSNQHFIFISVFDQVLQSLSLPHVSDIDFSWIPVQKCGQTENGRKFPGTDITIHFSMRDPFSPIQDPSKLIVASWAWDANSFPGNEYWSRSLTSSSDPAAACCSQIQETLNPFVNSTHYRGRNLRIARREGGLVTWKTYARDLLSAKKGGGE